MVAVQNISNQHRMGSEFQYSYRWTYCRLSIDWLTHLSGCQGKGYDTAKHILACFGGAGGQHACAIARSLGMSTVFIHRSVVAKMEFSVRVQAL